MIILLLSREAIKTTRRLSDTKCEQIQLQAIFLYLFLSQYTVPGNTAAVSFKFGAYKKKKKTRIASCKLKRKPNSEILIM